MQNENWTNANNYKELLAKIKAHQWVCADPLKISATDNSRSDNCREINAWIFDPNSFYSLCIIHFFTANKKR